MVGGASCDLQISFLLIIAAVYEPACGIWRRANMTDSTWLVVIGGRSTTTEPHFGTKTVYLMDLTLDPGTWFTFIGQAYQLSAFGASSTSVFDFGPARMEFGGGIMHHYGLHSINVHRFSWGTKNFARTGGLSRPRVRW